MVTDFVLIYESVTSTFYERRQSYECHHFCLHGRLYSFCSPWKMLVACSYPWKPLLIPLTRKTRSVPSRSSGIRISIETRVNFVATAGFLQAHSLPRKQVLSSRCLSMDYSGFQLSCHSILQYIGSIVNIQTMFRTNEYVTRSME
jgi:hypothetical protein